MKCSYCGNTVDTCHQCGNEFEEGDDMLCLDSEVHICDDRCLLAFARDANNVEKASVEE